MSRAVLDLSLRNFEEAAAILGKYQYGTGCLEIAASSALRPPPRNDIGVRIVATLK